MSSSRTIPAFGAKPVKLAEQIARGIEDRVVLEGWPVGHPLGREADLAAAAGVSRWTFREAVSLLEHNGMVETRRGGGGGLFVAASMADVLGRGLSNYLDFVRAAPEELVTAMRAGEAIMIERASAGLDPAAVAGLRPLIAAAEDPHRLRAFEATAAMRKHLVASAGNAAVTLLAGALSNLVMQAAWYSTLEDEPYFAAFPPMIDATRRLTMALIERRPDEAKRQSERYVMACDALFRSSATSGHLPRRPESAERAYRLYPPGRPMKKAERVARELRAIILEAGWPVGMHIGTEAELMAQFAVGRSVLREALRSLERLGVIAIGRGGASGVKVISPNPEELVNACRRFFRREGLTPEQALAVRDALLNAQRHAAAASTITDRREARFIPLMLAILEYPAAQGGDRQTAGQTAGTNLLTLSANRRM
ncbi:MAG: GntR family transcriptional regulator [Novosphingobium sp.]|nr:GntR family transcriptional regulator [Novosphingobium sp.]